MGAKELWSPAPQSLQSGDGVEIAVWVKLLLKIKFLIIFKSYIISLLGVISGPEYHDI